MITVHLFHSLGDPTSKEILTRVGSDLKASANAQPTVQPQFHPSEQHELVPSLRQPPDLGEH